jgi:hypothetical protein
MAAEQGLDLHQMDVDTAFLIPELPAETVLYMRLPDGRTVRLLKALYGLKQASRLWHACAAAALSQLGFARTSADECVFVTDWHGCRVTIVLYVDDLLIAAPVGADVGALKRELGSRFRMKDLGPASVFVGLQIERDRPAGILRVHQAGFTKQLLHEYRMLRKVPVERVATGRSTPFELKCILRKPVGGELLAAVAIERADHRFARLVGQLQWLVHTRPDIAREVGELARHVIHPSDAIWSAAKHLLRYLAGTIDVGLTYGRPGAHPHIGPGLVGFADANWGEDLDTRRSRTAYVFTYAYGVISAQSIMQPTVATSTTEAEYMASGAAAREAVYVLRLMADLGCGQPSLILYGDNDGARALAYNPVHGSRSKHIDVLWHYVRERVADGTITVAHVPTSLMAADFLTKGLPRVAFGRCLAALSIGSA